MTLSLEQNKKKQGNAHDYTYKNTLYKNTHTDFFKKNQNIEIEVEKLLRKTFCHKNIEPKL